jgi:hypothetical protein
LFYTQSSYIAKLFQRFQSFGITPAKLPMAANSHMAKREEIEPVTDIRSES